ncbi:MAG: DUF58 domain-containing protein [Deltaproteobacteria bacterium]|jgi:uncharacterized protein (DUF58 family)|nr:DUF58 domain-containing protein [Deltaproteobacteria bacterium]MBT6435432.1 DUF58 domain-containing protein [Deltaproteobacteria bacterium]
MTDNNLTDVLSPEIFARIKAIQIRTQRLVTDALAGDYESAFKGRGMEFEEVRAYTPGDDVRHIDWKVTARTSIPHIKVHREERELTVMLMVDVSSSGAFGTVNQFKNEIAAEVAAVLAYTAIKNNDRVGLIIFSDRIEHYVPPKKGRAHVWMVIRDILNFKPERRATDLDAAIEFMGKVIKHRSVAFVISDFIDHEVTQRLQTASKKHDLTAISISDPRELTLPPVGILELEDAETGETIIVDTRDKNTREGFRILGRDDRNQRREGFRRAGIGQIELRTDRGYIDPIMRFFRSRDAQR